MIDNMNNPLNNSFDFNELKAVLKSTNQLIHFQQMEIEALKRQQAVSSQKMNENLEKAVQLIINSNEESSTRNINDETMLFKMIQKSLTSNVMPSLERIVKDELNKCLSKQMVSQLIDPIREQISREIAEKMKSTDGLLRDSVTKMFKSKSTLDAIGDQVANSMQGCIINTYRELFNKAIIPSFEKSCQNMYQQVFVLANLIEIKINLLIF
jgi:uncharacterized membrane protein YheB (UPF0754 family)